MKLPLITLLLIGLAVPAAADARLDLPAILPEAACQHPELDPRYDGFSAPEAKRMCIRTETYALGQLYRLRRAFRVIPPARVHRCEALARDAFSGSPAYWELVLDCLVE